MDKDLLSIQEARDAAESAYEAQQAWSHASQEQVDCVCQAMADAGFSNAARLGLMAQEETGYGVSSHKQIKNEFASRFLWESIQCEKTVGVINQDPARKVYEIAWPVGVIAALTPSTNPTSTVLAKSIAAIKARNAIVFSPHPSAVKCCQETASLLNKAAQAAGAPANLVLCMGNVSIPGTNELMAHKRVRLILATGGGPMVKAAHSMGKPAYGVGPGNVPVYVDRSADLEKAARYIVASKAFDYSTICATEQAVVADRPIASRLAELMRSNGAYFTNENETNALRKLLFRMDGSMNTAAVGKSARVVAELAGFSIPEGTRILVTRLAETGEKEPLSREKLTTVLGWYEEDGWEAGCERSIALIHFGGRGHTQIIHAQDEHVIMQYGLEKPVFRIVVNSMGTLGAVGFTTGIMPSMTLGAGGEGGSITGDNITVRHLINIKRLAFEIKEPPLSALTETGAPPNPKDVDLELLVRRIVQQVLSK